MGKYILDGQVYVQRKTGIYRYCNEILKELDKIIKPGEVELLIPKHGKLEIEFTNIIVIRYGSGRGIIWAQTYLPLFCWKHKKIPVSFYNTTPILRPGIVVIHDVAYKAFAKGYNNIYGRLSSWWHRFNYWYISRQRYPIITVSNFSKNEICRYYGVNPNRIFLIGNGWQHYLNIHADYGVFSRHTDIRPQKYYFSLGSFEDRKNFVWVKQVAQNNPEEIFVIVGEITQNATIKDKLKDIDNLRLLGRLEDGEVKALICEAKAFLFPSIYEGFGIPPLEALSMGTRVLCANSSSLPEVLEDAATFFDPYDYQVDLGLLEKKHTLKPEKIDKVLGKYSWEKSARELLQLLREEN